MKVARPVLNGEVEETGLKHCASTLPNDGAALVVVTVYRRGAQEVRRRLEAQPLARAEAAAQAAAQEAAARQARARAQAARARAQPSG